LEERLSRAPDPKWADILAGMVHHLQNRLEYCEAINEVKIEDLPAIVKKQLGFEVVEV
jgi:hypothetical protein